MRGPVFAFTWKQNMVSYLIRSMLVDSVYIYIYIISLPYYIYILYIKYVHIYIRIHVHLQHTAFVYMYQDQHRQAVQYSTQLLYEAHDDAAPCI